MAASSTIQRIKNRSTKQASWGLKGGLLASLSRRSENVIVEAIIVPESKLCNVKTHYFLLTLWNVLTIPRANLPPRAVLR